MEMNKKVIALTTILTAVSGSALATEYGGHNGHGNSGHGNGHNDHGNGHHGHGNGGYNPPKPPVYNPPKPPVYHAPNYTNNPVIKPTINGENTLNGVVKGENTLNGVVKGTVKGEQNLENEVNTTTGDNTNQNSLNGGGNGNQIKFGDTDSKFVSWTHAPGMASTIAAGKCNLESQWTGALNAAWFAGVSFGKQDTQAAGVAPMGNMTPFDLDRMTPKQQDAVAKKVSELSEDEQQVWNCLKTEHDILEDMQAHEVTMQRHDVSGKVILISVQEYCDNEKRAKGLFPTSEHREMCHDKVEAAFDDLYGKPDMAP